MSLNLPRRTFRASNSHRTPMIRSSRGSKRLLRSLRRTRLNVSSGWCERQLAGWCTETYAFVHVLSCATSPVAEQSSARAVSRESRANGTGRKCMTFQRCVSVLLSLASTSDGLKQIPFFASPASPAHVRDWFSVRLIMAALIVSTFCQIRRTCQ